MTASQWLTEIVLLGVGAVLFPSAEGLMIVLGRAGAALIGAVTR